MTKPEGLDTNEFINVIGSKKASAVIILVSVLFALYLAFLIGTIHEGQRICTANNGTYLKNGQCILDKCLRDISVCKDGDDYIFVKNISWTAFQ